MIEQLRRELGAVGIRGPRRDRILAEFADHLACDPAAELGEPRALAEQFANELATTGARRAAFGTFTALSLVAVAFVGTQAVLPTSPDIAGGRSVLLAALATLGMVVGAQVAFASGSLALLRALRLRRESVLPIGEVVLLRRRTATALAAGAATVAGTALYAFNFWAQVPGWWSVLTVGVAGATLLPLAVAAGSHLQTASVAVSRSGPAAGLAADIGPFARPWLIGAAAVGAMLVASSIAERSLVEGVLRAAFEAVAFVACLLAFGRFLGLRR